MTEQVYIGLGSNLAEPIEQLQQAVQAIRQLPLSRLLKQSRWYGSHAVGPGTQPDYVNAAVLIETELAPLALLEHLQSIETGQGRVRHERWSARTLDLDILLFGSLQQSEPRLQVPHPRLAERNFVLWPLLDLTPQLCLPDATPLQSLADRQGWDGLWIVEPDSV